MTAHDVLRRLTPLIRTHTEGLPPDPAALTAETRLEQDLRMDSMAIVHVLEDIEDTFDVVIPDERLAGVYSVGDLVDIVRTSAGSAGRAA
ncbi:phosphopantetheine-binding protein [Streptomyces sp. NPDC007904]|jgi:acyl carrier protein|uniref:phosphopantetheine-binding protein n=1 Tax=Streptomyces sp. NPDC007904 TaxID=3364787 RepID=UPI0036E5AEB8